MHNSGTSHREAVLVCVDNDVGNGVVVCGGATGMEVAFEKDSSVTAKSQVGGTIDGGALRVLIFKCQVVWKGP